MTGSISGAHGSAKTDIIEVVHFNQPMLLASSVSFPFLRPQIDLDAIQQIDSLMVHH